MTHAIIIGADPSRSRSPRGERRSPAPQARARARTALPPLPCSSGQIMQGDCIERMRGMASESVDFILTDPPYVTRYRARDGRVVPNDNFAWLKPAFADLYRVLARDGFCVSFYGWANADLFTAAFRSAGFRFVGHIAFPKPYTSSSKYLSCRHESAYVLAKGHPPVRPNAMTDVIPWTTYTANKLHPTQKPLSVLLPLIEAFSAVGDVVLDPFAGSGSTLLAARSLGRRYLGIELDPGYHAIARRRLEGGEP